MVIYQPMMMASRRLVGAVVDHGGIAVIGVVEVESVGAFAEGSAEVTEENGAVRGEERGAVSDSSLWYMDQENHRDHLFRLPWTR